MDREHIVPLFGIAEPVSALSHLLLALAFLALTPSLLERARDDLRRRRALLVLASTFVLVFAVSGVYHGLPAGHPHKRLFWHLDHAAIWTALVGSVTGMMATLTRWDGRYLAVLWVLAAAGATCDVVFLDRLPAWFTPLLYVIWGWAGFPILLRVARDNGWKRASRLLHAGVLATIGGLIDAFDRPVLVQGVVEAHEVMHLLLAVGSATWFWRLYRSADGRHVPQGLELETARA